MWWTQFALLAQFQLNYMTFSVRSIEFAENFLLRFQHQHHHLLDHLRKERRTTTKLINENEEFFRFRLISLTFNHRGTAAGGETEEMAPFRHRN